MTKKELIDALRSLAVEDSAEVVISGGGQTDNLRGIKVDTCYACGAWQVELSQHGA